MLATPEEMEIWMRAPSPEAAALQQPLPDEDMMIVAHGRRQDGNEPER